MPHLNDPSFLSVECNFVAHRKCESRVVIGCTSSRLEQGILQHDKQVEDVERIAAREEVVVEEGKKEKEKQVRRVV